MAITLTTTARNGACDGVVNLANGGTLLIREGTTTLASATLESNAFEAAGTNAAGAARAIGDDGSAVVSSGNPIVASVTTDGTADGFQVKDSGGTLLWSGSVTVTGGGGEMTLSSVLLVAGGKVNITSWTYTQPS